MKCKTGKFLVLKKDFSLNNVLGIVIGVALLAFAGGVVLERVYPVGDLFANVFVGSTVDEANESLPENLDFSSVEKVYDVLRRNFDGELSEAALLDGLKSGLAQASGDPYTVYLNAEQAVAFNESLNGEFEGIGAEIGIKNDQLLQ